MQNRLFCALYNGVPLVRDVSQVTYIYKSVSIKFNLMQMPCDFTGPYSQDFQSGGGGHDKLTSKKKKKRKKKPRLYGYGPACIFFLSVRKSISYSIRLLRFLNLFY